MASVDYQLIEMSRCLLSMKNDLDIIIDGHDWPNNVALHGTLLSSELFRAQMQMNKLIDLVKEVSE